MLANDIKQQLYHFSETSDELPQDEKFLHYQSRCVQDNPGTLTIVLFTRGKTIWLQVLVLGKVPVSGGWNGERRNRRCDGAGSDNGEEEQDPK